MTSLAEALRSAIEEGDLAAFGQHLLQRARLDVGLAEIAGRPAILAWLNSLAAAFDGPRLHDLYQLEGPGILAVDCRIEGHVGSVPGIGPLDKPLLSAGLHLRLWARLEGQLAVELCAITDWSELLRPARLSIEEAAATLGGKTPCHRPLGELGSGLGQLGSLPLGDSVSPGERWVTAFNSRRLPGDKPTRARLRALLAQMPDARLLLEQELPADGFNRLLLLLQGHVAGRRVSLPASAMIGTSGTVLASESLRFDSLALAATAHRPFYPD